MQQRPHQHEGRTVAGIATERHTTQTNQHKLTHCERITNGILLAVFDFRLCSSNTNDEIAPKRNTTNGADARMWVDSWDDPQPKEHSNMFLVVCGDP